MTCKVAGCQEPREGRGYCADHLAAWKRVRETRVKPPRPAPPLFRDKGKKPADRRLRRDPTA